MASLSFELKNSSSVGQKTFLFFNLKFANIFSNGNYYLQASWMTKFLPKTFLKFAPLNFLTTIYNTFQAQLSW